jgi:hypothetical protein
MCLTSQSWRRDWQIKGWRRERQHVNFYN